MSDLFKKVPPTHKQNKPLYFGGEETGTLRREDHQVTPGLFPDTSLGNGLATAEFPVWAWVKARFIALAVWQTHWNPATHWAGPNSSHFRGEKLAGPIGNACHEPGAGLRRRLGGIKGGAEGTRAVPRGPGRVGKGTEFPQVPPLIPCPALGSPASRRPPLDLGGYPRSRLPEEARPQPGAADWTLSSPCSSLRSFCLAWCSFSRRDSMVESGWVWARRAPP